MNDPTKNLFEFIWSEIIYGHGGDGAAKIHLIDTDAEQMAKDFFEWIKKEKDANDFELNSDRATRHNVWSNQEGFIFTNEVYVIDDLSTGRFDDLVVITY